MKCKKVFGMLTCKVNSAEVVRLPNSIDNKIPINIYTSKNCGVCNQLVGKQLKRLKPLRNLVTPQVIDISAAKEIDPSVMALPSIQIGKVNLGMNPTDKDIVNTLRKYLPS